MKCPECDHDMNEGRCLYCGLVSEPDREGADSKGEGREDNPEATVETEAPDDEHITTDEKLAYKLKDLPDSMRLMVIQAMGKEDTMVADDDLLNLRIKEAFVHRDGEAQISRRAVDSKQEFGQIGQLVVSFRTFFLT